MGTVFLVEVGGAVPVVLMDQDDHEAEGLPAVALKAVLLVSALGPKGVFLWRVEGGASFQKESGTFKPRPK